MAHDDAGAIAVSYSDGLSLRLLDPPERGRARRWHGSLPLGAQDRQAEARHVLACWHDVRRGPILESCTPGSAPRPTSPTGSEGWWPRLTGRGS